MNGVPASTTRRMRPIAALSHEAGCSALLVRVGPGNLMEQER